MNLEQISIYAEIISAAAVVASLIYLGIQIKLGRIQAENEAIDVISSRRSDFIEIIARDKELSYIIAQGLASRRKLTPNEHFRYTSYLFTVFVALEIGFIKWHRKGARSEMWRAWDEVIRWWLSFSSVQRWWQSNVINGFTSNFNRYVQNLVIELQVEPPADLGGLVDFLEMAGNKTDE